MVAVGSLHVVQVATFCNGHAREGKMSEKLTVEEMSGKLTVILVGHLKRPAD